MYELIGRPFTEQLKRSEAARYVQECLLSSPYIKDVREIVVEFNEDKLTISCVMTTIYGEVTL